jgi:glycerol-3-phosphate dehydrogenase
VPIPVYDIAIIGGGINGCGVARDAAGRGLAVHLCEQGDLAGATSSASTKLLFGASRERASVGLRGIRERLAEQDVLLATAPHLVRPIRVVRPGTPKRKPAIIERARVLSQGILGRRTLMAPARLVDLRAEAAGQALASEYASGVELPDCWIDDARLVIANAIDAKARGAHIQTRTRCIAARRSDSYWRLLLESSETGKRWQIAARALVNATGPWASHILDHVIQGAAHVSVRLVKGTHLIAHGLYQHDQAYELRNADGRFIHVVPFERNFTLVGPIETDYRGDPGQAEPNDDEIEHLCAAVSQYLREPLTRESICFVYCGVRPLVGAQDGAKSKADADLHLDGSEVSSPLLSIVGGNIATYRRMAERVLGKLAPFLRPSDPWTARSPLPGGGFGARRGTDLVRALRAAYPFLAELHAERLVSAYGTRAPSILTGARRMEDLGRNFGWDLTEAEVVYLMTEEWAVTAGDVLWRRSRLGLHFDPASKAALERWMAAARLPAN